MCQHSLFAWASTLAFSYIKGKQDGSADHPVKCSEESCLLFWDFFFPHFFSTFPSPWRDLPLLEMRSRWDPKEWVLGPTKASEAPDKTPSPRRGISNSTGGTGTPLPKVLLLTLSLTKSSLFLELPEPNRLDFFTFCVLLAALCFWISAWC